MEEKFKLAGELIVSSHILNLMTIAFAVLKLLDHLPDSEKLREPVLISLPRRQESRTWKDPVNYAWAWS